MFGLIEIKDDLFDIANRLKEVDERYAVYYNKIKGRYEIYTGKALQIVVPFQRLDARTVYHARKTKIENRKKIIAEIEKNNALIEERERKAAIERALAKAEF